MTLEELSNEFDVIVNSYDNSQSLMNMRRVYI